MDGGPTGEDPPPPPELIDLRDCSSGIYTFDLAIYRDALYTLQLTETDTTGGVSTAEDSFRLDRVAYTPIIRTGPDDVSNDPTPTWTFYFWGETAPRFDCTLIRAGWSAPIYQGACSRETFTVDLNPFPDDDYTLSVTLTDQAGNTSESVTDTFVLDRTIPNASPTASFTVRCFLRSCDFDGTASEMATGQSSPDSSELR